MYFNSSAVSFNYEYIFESEKVKKALKTTFKFDWQCIWMTSGHFVNHKLVGYVNEMTVYMVSNSVLRHLSF